MVLNFNIDPVTVTIGGFIIIWIFRVDRKITRLETWIKSCGYCRKELKPGNDEKN